MVEQHCNTAEIRLPIIDATAEKIQVQFGNNSGRSVASDGIIGRIEEIYDLIDPAVPARTESVAESSSFHWYRRFKRLSKRSNKSEDHEMS